MITKSDYVSFLRCNAKFVLDASKAKQADTVFTSFGHLVGTLAQLGICENTFDLIDEIDDYKIDILTDKLRDFFRRKYKKAAIACEFGPGFNWADAVAKTQQLMLDHDLIFEAAFEREGCVCLVDALYRYKDKWRVIECKSFLDKSALKKASRANSGSWLDDITFQYWVVSATIPDVRFGLLCLNHNYDLSNHEIYFSNRLSTANIPKRLAAFVTDGHFDLQAAIQAHLRYIPTNLAALRSGQKNKTIQITSCKRCQHLAVCRGNDWGGLFWKGSKFVNRTLSELNEPDVTNKDGSLGPTGRIQKRMLDARRANKLISIETGLLPFNSFDKCIDFESLIHPVPQYPGCRPWAQIPFMFAVGRPNEIEVHIAPDPKTDPRYYLIEELCKLECHGRLFHWGRYDRDVIKKLANCATEPQSKILLKLAAKMVDLCDIVKRSTYHPAFDFSFSIKKVGPFYSNLSYDGCESDALTAGIDWLDGNVEAVKRYCSLDVEQMFAVAKGVLGSCAFGSDIPAELLAMVSSSCDEVNANSLKVPFAEDLEMKTKSGLMHDYFMGALERRGCKKGPLSGKPDLFLILDNTCYLIEIKASGKSDWQTHTTEGQSPLPPGNIHILLDIDAEAFRIANVYALLDATWERGSSKNGIYERLTPDSISRMILVWGESRCPMLPIQDE